MNKDKQKLIELGFEGFKTVRELMMSCRDIPKAMGVYVVLREKNERPKILEKRPFDCLEEKYPSYSKTELEKEWVEGTQIVYIGKAGGFGQKTGLHKRLSTYIRFGKGKKAAHGGGRSIWQLSDALDLVVCWRILSDEEPCCIESDMIANFCKKHDGKRPFANRRD
jgi:hypothetical protein